MDTYWPYPFGQVVLDAKLKVGRVDGHLAYQGNLAQLCDLDRQACLDPSHVGSKLSKQLRRQAGTADDQGVQGRFIILQWMSSAQSNIIKSFFQDHPSRSFLTTKETASYYTNSNQNVRINHESEMTLTNSL